MFKTIIFVAFVANILLIVSASKPSYYDESQNCTTTKPPKCGKLEVPDSCVNGRCYKERKCSDINSGYICKDVTKCEQGCLCKEGYLRNKDGKCILRNECPEKLKCPRKYEVYDPCVNKCYPDTCQSIGKQYDCPLQSANKTCTGGCVCEPGYFRNKVGGDCISEEDCKKCTGPNEYFACGGACDNVCEFLPVRNQTNCDIVNIKCNDMCYCDEGYARDANGKCVPFDECPKKESECLRAHEVYDPCVNKCSPGTCQSIGKKYHCPLQRAKKTCTGGCVCEPGYFWNKVGGYCVSEEDCKKCTGPNEYFACGGACDNVCEFLAVRNQTDCDIINIKCNEMCYCDEGYARDANGKCVPFDQCPKKEPKCGKFEVADSCANGGCYDERKCTDMGNPPICVDPMKCEQGCLCKPGYLRDAHGKCIPREKCPNFKCGKNEQLIKCPSLYCKPRTCEQKGTKPVCLHISPGLPCPGSPGCVCKTGYLRDSDGVCIPEDQCPSKCGINEEHSDCINGGCFGATTCDEMGKVKVKCVKLDPKDCIKGCKCIDGHVRNANGTCIPEKECPTKKKCTGPNEHYACGGACDNECETLSVRNQTNCDVINKKCNNMCYCDEGYARNDSGKCVPFDQCPEKEPKCGKFEVANSCINGGCYDERKCSDMGKPRICVDPIKCKKGCLCKPGYLRDDHGKCIPREKCPNFKCGKNEQLIKCPALYCKPRTCEQKGTKPFCPRISPGLPCPGSPGCVCKTGYLRNSDGVCVPEDQCPPKCGKFEVANSCINGGCYDERNCTDIGKPRICVDPIKCKKGCLCKPGYLRDDHGKCIPREKCPNSSKCGINEEHSDCINGGCFGAKTCDEMGKVKVKCVKLDPKDCIKGCKCIEGHVRNANGTCIPEKECPTKKKCTGLNEYFACGGACDNVCEFLAVRNQTNCDIINVKCNDMCYCDEGYARDDSGKCVPFDQCPKKEPKCGKFEVANSCINGGCYDERNCTDIGKPRICVDPIKCKKGCLCKPGYLRDAHGKCIPREKCPNFKCGKYEQLIKCPPLYCKPKTCEQKGTKPLCPRMSPGLPCPGSPGCVCKTGYLRDSDGVCIPEDQCPPKCGINEVHSTCINGGCFGAKKCEEVGKVNRKCVRIDPKYCIKGCKCIDGHVRNANGTCIPENQCPKPPKCGKFEVADSCANGGCYDERKCTDMGNPPICVDPAKCEQGCLCKPGYLRDDHGKCIPREKCPNYCESDGDNSNEKDSAGESNSSNDKKKYDDDECDETDEKED